MLTWIGISYIKVLILSIKIDHLMDHAERERTTKKDFDDDDDDDDDSPCWYLLDNWLVICGTNLLYHKSIKVFREICNYILHISFALRITIAPA